MLLKKKFFINCCLFNRVWAQKSTQSQNLYRCMWVPRIPEPTCFSDSVSWQSVFLSTFSLKRSSYKDSAILSPSSTSPRLRDLRCTWRGKKKKPLVNVLRSSPDERKDFIRTVKPLCCNTPVIQRHRSNTDLLRSANGQGVVVIRLLGVVIRTHFVDIKSHIVSLLVARCPAWEQAQDQDPEQRHGPLEATWEGSGSTVWNPCKRDGRRAWRIMFLLVLVYSEPTVTATTRSFLRSSWFKMAATAKLSMTGALSVLQILS